MAVSSGEGAGLHRLFLAGMRPLMEANSTLGSSGTSSMDNGMVIVLVALLCALILAVGLNSLLSCVRSINLSNWYSRDLGAGRTASTSASRLSSSVLNEITMVVVASQPGIPATDCSICLGEFLDSEKVRVLPICKHGFHVSCIDTWLLAHSSCPLCRRPLLHQAPPT